MRCRVRIVEDNRDIVHYLRLHLERNDFEVEATVKDFEDCFDPATWEHVDRALVDLHLDGPVTGQDVLVWLRANHPGIKRVAFSADVAAAFDLGDLAHDVLIKPADPASLLHALRDPGDDTHG